MDSHVLARRGAIGLGVLYVLLGVAETVRLTVAGDGGFAFWFGTLVGGGALLLAGALPSSSGRGGRRAALVAAGAVLGVPATAWTVVVPLVALGVLVLTLLSLREPERDERLGGQS